MANLRTTDYKGFNNATASAGYEGAGLILWSGSMVLDSAGQYTSYSGVGLELVSDGESYLRFATSTSTQVGELDVRANKFYVGSPTSQFISGSGGNIEISSSAFHLSRTGDVIMSGSITAAEGYIGDWKIVDGKLSGSNATLDAVGAALYHTTKGPGSDTPAGGFHQLRDEYYIDFTPSQGPTATAGKYYVKFGPNFSISESGVLFASGAVFEGTITASAGLIGGYNIESHSLTTTGFAIGDSTEAYAISSSNFNVDHTGVVTASAGLIGGFELSSTEIKSSNNNLRLKSSGDITGSQVLFDGGTIGGITIDGDSLSIGTSYKISSSTDTNDPVSFISSSNFKVSAGGTITASAGLIGNWAINGGSLVSTTNGATNGKGIFLEADDTPRIVVREDGNNAVSMLYTDSTNYGIQGLVGGERIFGLGNPGNSGNTIAGWTFDSEKLTGGHMIIRKDGTIESDGFVTNLPGSGFRLTAASGGMLEVENARIRGTLSTAVFEKETVNAVGGQLYVANSTTLTGSATHPQAAYSNTDTTMSVVNVTGFSSGEILSAKKVNDTGFQTEYLLVNSSSRANKESGTDYTGNIYVTRGYGSGVTGDSASLGNTPGAAQSYTGSQVLVSTGKLNTGYIRLNANPNDEATPYMQIVERTGSGIYDLELKAQLGDLSGISSGKLFGETNPGFGLFSENVFLTGGIVAQTGSIAGIEMESGKLYTGPGVHGGGTTGFYLDSGSKFSLGDKLTWDGDGNLVINGTITIGADSIDNSGIADAAEAAAAAAQASVNNITATQTTHLFGGPSGSTISSGKLIADGETTGSLWYQSGSSYGSHETKNGVLMLSSSMDESYQIHTAVLRSSQSYNRNSGIMFTSDVTYMQPTQKFIIGFGKNTSVDVSDFTPGAIPSVSQPPAHAFRFDAGALKIIEGSNTSTHRWSNYNDVIAVGDKLRLTIEPYSGSGALYKIYKFPDLTTPGFTTSSLGESWATTEEMLDIQLATNNNTATSNIFVDSIYVTSTTTPSATATTTAQATANTATGSADAAQATANTATGSADAAQATANTATGSADAAQATANTATGSADAAQATANTATGSAAAAQAAIDAMETQVVLDSGGMGLWSSGGVSSGFLVADYGTTTKFYDGVDDQAANVKLQLNADGVKAYGDNTSTYANVTSAGLDIVEDSTNVANFGSSMRVGVSATDKSALRVDSSGNVTLGTSNKTNITINADGTAVFSGSISASAGQIAGFNIDDTKLKQGTSFYLDGASNADYFISSSKFAVTPGGSITASSAFFEQDVETAALRQRVITIDASNARYYFKHVMIDGQSNANNITIYTATTYLNVKACDLYLDGSLGGEITNHVIIEQSCFLDAVHPGEGGQFFVMPINITWGTDELESGASGVRGYVYGGSFGNRAIAGENSVAAALGPIRRIHSATTVTGQKTQITIEANDTHEVSFISIDAQSGQDGSLGQVAAAVASRR